MDFVFGILGIIGGLLCSVGDMLFDLKGKGNIKSGPSKIVDSNWEIMSEWRFSASILVASLGVPCYLLGFLGMYNQLVLSNETVATTFLVFAILGSSGGLFIHSTVCLMPIISKTLTKHDVSKNIIDTICSKIYNAVKIPLIVMFCSLVIATSITLIYSIIRGYLNVPFAFAVINPLGLMLIGWVFRLINKRVFSDLPGIIMPSVGIAMIGLMTIISSLN